MQGFTEAIKQRMDVKSQDISRECTDIRKQVVIDPNDDDFENEYIWQ